MIKKLIALILLISSPVLAGSPVIWGPGKAQILTPQLCFLDNTCMSTAAGGGSGVTDVTATLPILSSGGTTPNLSCRTATGSVSGCLSSADWSAFSGKQDAGSYVTALTGDVTAAGPGSSSSTLAAIQGTAVGGTTGTGNVVFSVAPSLDGPVAFTGAFYPGRTSINHSNSPYTTDPSTSDVISVDTNGGPVTVRLSAFPNLGNSGQDVWISDTGGDAATNAISIVPQGGDDFADGSGGKVIDQNFGWLHATYDNDIGGWMVMGSSDPGPVVVGDFGSGGAKGLVPAPQAGDSLAGKFLKADGLWTNPFDSIVTNPKPDANVNYDLGTDSVAWGFLYVYNGEVKTMTFSDSFQFGTLQDAEFARIVGNSSGGRSSAGNADLEIFNFSTAGSAIGTGTTNDVGIRLQTADSSIAADTTRHTSNIELTTGNAGGGSQDSGSISFTTGTAGGTRGTIDLNSAVVKLSGLLDEAQQPTPSNPSGGRDRLYFKSDDNLYKLNSAGVESQVGGGTSITALTGEGSATGPGSATFTLGSTIAGATTFSTSLTSPIFKSSTANPATSGAVRLAAADTLDFRDTTGSWNNSISIANLAVGEDMFVFDSTNGNGGLINLDPSKTGTGGILAGLFFSGNDPNRGTIDISGTNYNPNVLVENSTLGGSLPVALGQFSTDSSSSALVFVKARGSATTPTAVSNSDAIGAVAAVGFDGTDFQPAAQIVFQVNNTPSAGVMPGAILFQVTPDSSNVLGTALAINRKNQANFQGTQVLGASSILDSAAPTTGGSASTTKPLVLFQNAGASNNWSTSGTVLGINPATGFAGNLIDAQVNAVNKFKVDSSGDVLFTGYTDEVQQSTPSNPSASHDRLYFKSDDNLYKLTSAGVESAVGGSAGGFFDFGDASDGDAVLDGVNTFSWATLTGGNLYRLNRTPYLHNLTVNNGITFVIAPYMLFGTGTLTNNGSISSNGTAGGTGAAAGTGGSAGLRGGTTSGVTNAFIADFVSADGAVGGAGNVVNGNNGLGGAQGNGPTGTLGGTGGNGGTGGFGSGATGKAGGGCSSGTGCFSFRKLTNTFIAGTVRLAITATGGSGGAGAGDGSSVNGGGGGGSGGNGGLFAIFFSTIDNTSGTISANGGNGGNGGTPTSGAGTGGGGGGGGGVGGWVYIVANTWTAAGTITASGGSGGTHGTGFGGGTNGTDGTSGSSGVVLKYNVTTKAWF